MTYNTIFAIANDAAFRNRVTAALADEGSRNPDSELQTIVWPVAAADDITAAYASAVAAGNPNPGGDESVITDQMILSAVQAARGG